MRLNALSSLIERTPFLKFARLHCASRAGGHTAAQLPFEGLLKNHVGTLHAGALFTVAHTSARAVLDQAHAMSLIGFESTIVFKRPSKGPVWASSELIDSNDSYAAVKTTIFSETDEPLVEFTIRFESKEAA